jgi:hypothetical protein
VPDLMWFERHLVGFENRLKDVDRVKGKVAESLAVKGRTVDEAMKLIPDTIRYTFCYHEADYSRHLLADIALTQERFSDLVRLRNFWTGDQYKGISSLWRDHGTGQLFEMQFHTDISYHAMVFTAERPYARLRSAQTCAQRAQDSPALLQHEPSLSVIDRLHAFSAETRIASAIPAGNLIRRSATRTCSGARSGRPNDLRARVRAGLAGGGTTSVTVMSGPLVSTMWTRFGNRVRKARKLRQP